MSLAPKQIRFCEEYLIDLNGKNAAIRAGYSAGTAEVQASRLLRNAKVSAHIQALKNARSKRSEITADRVVAELARIAFANARDVMRWNASGVEVKDSGQLTEDQAAAVAEVHETTNEHGGSLRVKMHDKVRALELLGKHFGLFVEKINHSGTMTLEQLIAGTVTRQLEEEKPE